MSKPTDEVEKKSMGHGLDLTLTSRDSCAPVGAWTLQGCLLDEPMFWDIQPASHVRWLSLPLVTAAFLIKIFYGVTSCQ